MYGYIPIYIPILYVSTELSTVLICYILLVCINTVNPSGGGGDGDGDSENNTGAIIGGIVGGVVGLIIISAFITLVVIWWRNNHNQKDNDGKNFRVIHVHMHTHKNLYVCVYIIIHIT